jgi:hypothetical protein
MKVKHLQQFLLALALVWVSLTGTNAQQTYSCIQPGSPPPPNGTTKCSASCIYCNLDGVADMNNATLPAPQATFCMQLENPRWYGFIAGSNAIAFQLKITTTTNGNGLEAMIMSDCNTLIACQPGVAGNGINPVTIYAFGLTIGKAYQLCVDGMTGDVCKYTITVPLGTTIPPPIGAIGAIQGLGQVCPNATVTYTIPPVANAISYLWTAPAGSSINGGANTISLPASTGTSIDVQFGTLGGTICCIASNACSAPVSVCKTITNTPLSIVDLPMETICYEGVPYVWPEQPNNVLAAPGTYTLISTPYASYLGCDSIVRQKVRILPFKIKNLAPIFLCPGQCYNINGNSYCQSGSYSETLSTADGCDSLVNFNIHVVPVHAVIQTPDTITCAVPTVPLTGIGSTTGNTVTYNWTNSSGQTISTTLSAIATAGGIYHLIVNNFMGGIGCHDTATVNVPAQTTVPYANAGAPKVLTCSQPQIQLHGTASTGSQFTYLWIASNGGNIVSGANTLNPLVNAVGTYKLYVTNTQNGCTTVSTTSVTATTLPPSVSATGGTINCLLPTLTLGSTTNASNGTFSWTGPNGFTSSAANPTVNAGGSYVLVVTDGITGCASTATATVVADIASPGATATGGTITCVVSSVTLDGTSPANGVTFAWTGPNGFTSGTANPTVTVPGAYILLVTGTNGCTSTAATSVILNNTLPGAAIDVSGNLNCHNATVNLVATSTANPVNLDHLWIHPDTTQDDTGTGTLLVVNQPGTYNLIVTNTVNGCTSTATATVVKHEPVATAITSQTEVSCFNSSDGQVSVSASGGNSAYTYQWSNAATTASNTNLGPGPYTVTVADGEGCTASISTTISQPDQLAAHATATPQTANGTTDGTATANPTGGTPNYTYSWSNGGTTQSLTGLTPGFYTVTVIDQHGCTAVQTVTVNPYNCVIEAALHAHNVTCHGADDGWAYVSINGGTSPFTYTWLGGSHVDTLTNLAPGQYSVSIFDAANCPVALSFTILQPDTLLANASATGSSGPTTSNGTATSNPSGGSGTYSYMWSTGGTTSSISNLAGGTYTVTVTDSNNCTAVQSVEVTVGNCGLLTSFLLTNPTCNGQSTGSATIVLTGGNSPFTYNWSSGGTGGIENNLKAGIYHVTVTDVNGCQISDSTTLSEPALLTATIDSTVNAVCQNSPVGALHLTSTGGTGNAAILWSTGQTDFAISGLIAGNYSATVSDENGCTTTASAQVQAIDAVAPDIQADSTGVNLGPSGSITLTAQNLNATITDNCLVASVKIVPSTFHCTDLGNHQVTITAADDSGNSTSKTIVVTIVDNSPPVLVCPPSVVRCAGDGLVQYNAPTATDNCLGIGGGFALTSGLASGSVFPEGTTTNMYTYTDGQGNTGSCTFEVTVLSPLTAKVDTVVNDIANQNIGSIHISVNGSLSPYHFHWLENGNAIPDSTQNLTGIGAGSYTLIVTDANGCTTQIDTIKVKSLVATNNPDWISEVGIFPNPTTGQLTVIFPDQLVGKEVQVSAFDQTGRRVFEQISARDKALHLDLTGFAEGMYFLQIRLDQSQVVRKIVLTR